MSYINYVTELVPRIEAVEYQGRIFYRIDPTTIDLDAMEEFQKLTDIYAWQVGPGQEVEVKTVSVSDNATAYVSVAREGDWVEYNIGSASEYKTLLEKLNHADKKIMPDEIFQQLYRIKERLEDYFKNHPEEQCGGSESEDEFHGEKRGALYEYIGAPVKACRVPFNFVLRTMWGRDQFICKGGVIVYNPRTSKPGRLDIYAAGGSHDRHPGQFEKTYGHKGERRSLAEVHAYVFKADLSPLPGIQFTKRDLQQAYEQMAGQALKR